MGQRADTALHKRGGNLDGNQPPLPPTPAPAPTAHSCHAIREHQRCHQLWFRVIHGLDVRAFSPAAWVSPIKEDWHSFLLFAARKVGTDPLYFLVIVDITDDASTRYLAWHYRKQREKNSWKNPLFFFQFIQLEIVLFHYLLPKFLENNTRQEGGISWYAVFQGVGRFLTAFWVLPETHQLWEEGLHWSIRNVCARTNKRSSKSNPLISLSSCMPDHL